MAKKKGGGGGGANWMDTYGDMVTLLLCFFVLLYSISVIDEVKWLALVKSFNPDAVDNPTEIPLGTEGPVADPTQGAGLQSGAMPEAVSQEEIDGAMDMLYEKLKEYSEQSDSAQSIETIQGDGYVFISLENAVIFDGNSYNLRKEGEKVLGDVATIFTEVAKYIDEIRILGHTAQASPSRPNYPLEDRMLSSNRAAMATYYIQENSEIDPARIISVGYGQHRPVAPNDDEANRSHNRRVEIIITGRNVLDDLSDSIKRYEALRTGEGSAPTDSL